MKFVNVWALTRNGNPLITNKAPSICSLLQLLEDDSNSDESDNNDQHRQPPKFNNAHVNDTHARFVSCVDEIVNIIAKGIWTCFI
jgi:hypothetical protein